MMSLSSRSNSNTWGNDLGVILLGILVCEKEGPRDRESKAKFFHKSKLIYPRHSDIVYRDFNYDAARVVSVVPLSIELSSFHSGYHLKAKSEKFREAKKLLQKYGFY